MTSQRASLEGPRAKLARADEHRHALHDKLAAYAALDPIRVTPPLIEPDGSGFVMFGRTDPEPPIELGLILGDYITNLRAALDHLVWQLVLLAGNTPTKTNQFPIVNTEAQFESAKTRQLRGVAPTQVESIGEVQPYTHPVDPEEHPLALLRWLSNTDKHQVIHLLSTSVRDADPRTSGFRLIKGSGALGTPQIRGGADVNEDEPILRVSLSPPDPTAEAEWYGTFDVHLVFGTRRARDEAVQYLQGVVSVIIDHCAPDFGE